MSRRNADKQKDGKRRDKQQRLRTLQGKPSHIYTLSAVHFACICGSTLLHCDTDGCHVRNIPRLGGDPD
jgi:hypothetical protein